MTSFRIKTAEVKETNPSNLRIFLAAAVPSWLLYVFCLPPAVTSEDSGELITAAYTLGIAHPPGYPLWCILGKLFTFVPLGSVAWRVALMSATFGALSVGLLALISRRLTKNVWVSLVAALLFAVSRDFWNQSVIAEVYTLNVFLILLVMQLLFLLEEREKTRWLYLAAFTLGIGSTNHSTFIPLSVLFLVWVLVVHPDYLLRPVLLLNLVLAFLAGFSIIFYLPIRSAADPFLDWGKPESISAMLGHFLRKQYTDAEEPLPRTIVHQATLVMRFLETFSAQFTLPVAALAFVGAFLHRQKDRKTFWLFACLFGLTSYGFIWLINYPADRENVHLTRVFFLPANAVAAVWIAFSLSRLSEILGVPSSPGRERSARVRIAFAGSGAAIVLFPLALNLQLNDQRWNHLAEDWGRNILRGLKPNSIIVPSADHSTFPVLYLKAVEGMRPDVLVADKYGYIEDRVFRELFRGKDTPRAAPPLGGSPEEKQKYLVEHSGRPVYFTTKVRLDGLDSHELVTWGLVYEAVPKGTKPDTEEHRKLWDEIRFHDGVLDRTPGDFSQDLILSDYHFARGRYAVLFQRDDEALTELNVAARYGYGIKEIQNNLGGTLAEAGKPELAIPFLRAAYDLDPEYEMATKNLASVYFSLKRYKEGLPHFERALTMDPGNPVALLGLARAKRDEGRLQSSYLDYRVVLERDPYSPTLREEAHEVAVKAFGKDSPLAMEIAESPRPPRRDEFEGEPQVPATPSVPSFVPGVPMPPDPLSDIRGTLGGAGHGLGDHRP